MNPEIEKIAGNWAKSIFSQAEKEKKTQEVYLQLKKISDQFANNPGLLEIFKNNSFSELDRKKVVDGIISKDAKEKLLYNFLTTLYNKKRFYLVRNVFEEFNDLYKKKNGITDVVVKLTARDKKDVGEEISKFIQDKFAGKCNVEFVEDESLIGGFIVSYNNKMHDHSLKNQLEQIINNFGGQNA